MDDDNYYFRAETDLATVEARKRKAERTKHLGDPIDIPAKPLAIQVRGGELWIAESDHIVRRIDLESGKTLQVYKGHGGPVTTLAVIENPNEKQFPLLVSGSWDKTVKIWDSKSKAILSSINAHTDFVKHVYAVPELKLLISSGSDRVVRFWDLTDAASEQPGGWKSLGSISAHTRPVQCVAVDVQISSTAGISGDAGTEASMSATLYTADSMGVVHVWTLERTFGATPGCRATQIGSVTSHRTGVNDMKFARGELWTASSDDTALLTLFPAPVAPARTPPPLQHPTAVRALLPLTHTPVGEPLLVTAAGDVLRVYDISEPANPVLLSTTDAHWHNVIALGLWYRRVPVPVSASGAEADTGPGPGLGGVRVEPWILSASLDGTVRRWRLEDLVNPPKEAPKPPKPKEEKQTTQLTAEEEAELAELMEDD